MIHWPNKYSLTEYNRKIIYFCNSFLQSETLKNCCRILILHLSNANHYHTLNVGVSAVTSTSTLWSWYSNRILKVWMIQTEIIIINGLSLFNFNTMDKSSNWVVFHITFYHFSNNAMQYKDIVEYVLSRPSYIYISVLFVYNNLYILLRKCCKITI